MAWVIAGTYEVLYQIGAGGGGIVYLGRHLRLNKQVVLKADRRTLNTKSEVLRREVDMLKGLSHTYIPQVYDFVQENGIVYTVMDYIDGESLDKMLKREETPSQPQLIKWACQLLEALNYLHSRPPHGILHGDIKPANIMVRQNGDICLIDYNIALALGEEGAVKAGFSRGYASPEHYGMEYGKMPGEDDTAKMSSSAKGMDETVAMTEGAGWEHKNRDSASQSTGGHCEVMLDVRSDIYSLGATLYHLISGSRPPQDAREVEPLGPDVCSPQVSKILQKAMAVSPAMRYQTAGEMLTAFHQLHKKDSRVIRRKKHMAVSAAFLSGLFLAGGISCFVGLKQMEGRQEALALAEYSANSLATGNVSEAVSLALQGIPEKKGIFQAPMTAQTQKALTDALGVYDLSDGFKFLDTIGLPSAPYTIAISPGGTYVAAVYQYELAIFHMESGQCLATLPVENSALSDVIFIDEELLAYAGAQGVAVYDLKDQKTLWTGDRATMLTVSGDGQMAAAVDRDADHAVIYRVSDGERIGKCSFEGKHMDVAANDIFADPDSSIFSLNKDGDLLAVSFSDGGLYIFDWKNPEENMIVYDESSYGHFDGGFCGDYFAFSSNKSDQSIFGLVDTKEGTYVGEYESRDNFLVTAGEKGIYFANGGLLVKFDPDTLSQMELAYMTDVKITGFSIGDSYVLTAADDKSFSFFDQGANLLSSETCNENCDFVELVGEYAVVANRNEPLVHVLKAESHKEEQLMSYDARYLHDEARISQDGKTAMLFNYQDFRIYDREGKLVTEKELPDSRNIYDQQFRKSEDGSWLEVIWYDGTVRTYNAADGTMLSEEKGEPPAKDLFEEFYTDRYRVASSLHGAPEVYDKKSGRKVKELEKESYLTYVTQEGEYIITEYVSAAGERYGLLLDENLETLAYLPGLCDVSDGMLIFDYDSGDLRQCRIYSLAELVDLGKGYLEGE